MTYSHALTHTFPDDSVTPHYDALLKETASALASLRKKKASLALPVLSVGAREDDLVQIESVAARIRRNFKTLVVIGMGGSSRGGRTLCALADNPFAPARPQILFVENIDPHASGQMLAGIDFPSTCFLIISKSGDTAETLAHTLILLEAAKKKLGAKIAAHFITIAQPGDNALRRIAGEYGFEMLDHDPKIGGRFAALTAVGLLPAAVAGLDIRAVRKGANDACIKGLEAGSEPAKGAAANLALAKAGKSIAVMLPYCDRLDALSLWYQQLWAESLGKKGHGTTPLRSLGATDQHSMLQLYLDGPRDKFVTFLLLALGGKGPAIPATADKALSYLSNHSLGDLMHAEQTGTLETLAAAKCPLRVFTLAKLDEETLGGLMMHFMLETMIAAELLRIDAFDQPAVEDGKARARAMLALK